MIEMLTFAGAVVENDDITDINYTYHVEKVAPQIFGGQTICDCITAHRHVRVAR